MPKDTNFPALEALLRGFSEEEAAELRELFSRDREAFKAHMAKVDEVGGDRHAVNTAVFLEMGRIPRGDSERLFDAQQMETRCLGHEKSAEDTDNAAGAANAAKLAFRWAKKQTGWKR